VIFIQAAYGVSALTMSSKVREIQRKLAKLEKEADELKLLKSDYHYARKFRRMIVKQQVD
jgi:hypothetical protein